MRLLFLIASLLLAAITVAQTPKAIGVADFISIDTPVLSTSESSMVRVSRLRMTRKQTDLVLIKGDPSKRIDEIEFDRYLLVCTRGRQTHPGFLSPRRPETCC
jgi:hypothetical protein